MVAELCGEFWSSPPWPQDLLGLAFLPNSLYSLRGPAWIAFHWGAMEDYLLSYNPHISLLTTMDNT